MKEVVQEITSLSDLVKSINVHISGNSAFTRFKRMYENDRIAFVYDILPDLGKTFAPYQEEILGYFDDGYSRVAVRGPHGLGKTALASVIVHHTVLTAPTDCKVPTTATAWRQLEKFLWPEIKKTSRLIRWDRVGRPAYDQHTELMSLNLKLDNGLVEGFAVASDDHTTMEGAHATRIFYILDEAKAIARPTWDAIEGAFSNAGAEIVGESTGAEYGVGEYGVYEKAEVSKEYVKANLTYVEDIPEVDKPKLILPGGIRNAVVSGAMGVSGSVSIVNQHTSAPPSSSHVQSDASSDTSESESSFTDVLADNAKNKGSSVQVDFRSMSAENSADESQTDTDLKLGSIARLDAAYSNYANSSVEGLSSAGLVRTQFEAFAFAISTPGVPNGQFYDIHMRKPGYEDWVARHVTIEEAIIANRVSAKWVLQREKQWGRDSAVFQNRVLGEFADTSEEGVIPLSWIQMAIARWKDWSAHGRKSVHGKRTMGVDVARSGDDKTVLAIRDASLLQNLYVFSKSPTTKTAGNVKTRADNRYIHIEVDGGLGAAVYDMLREQSVPLLRPITVGGKTSFRDKSAQLSFENVRAAMWWNMRELLDPDEGEEIMLPPIEELKIDLSAPTWETSSDGVVKVESKKSIRARIGRSTDYGDAVCLAFWKTTAGGGVVF